MNCDRPASLFRASFQHPGQCFGFRRSCREAPGGLDADPIGSVLAPVAFVRRTPLVWASRSFGTVGRGSDGDKMGIAGQIVGIGSLAFGSPGVAPRAVGIGERHHVIDVQLGGLCDNRSGERPEPLAGDDLTLAVGLERHVNQTLGDQDFVPGILAVAILVDPVTPVAPVVVREIGWDRCDHDHEGDDDRCGRRRLGWHGC